MMNCTWWVASQSHCTVTHVSATSISARLQIWLTDQQIDAILRTIQDSLRQFLRVSQAFVKALHPSTG
jgi:hypothetical protein